MLHKSEIQEVLELNPGLAYEEVSSSFKGIINVNHYEKSCDEHVDEDYEVIIKVPNDYPESLPKVRSITPKLPKGFSHIYADGSLCLETDVEQLIFFTNGHTLKQWIDEYVKLCFFSIEYYRKYNRYPFGDRSHGYMGKLGYYRDKLKVKDLKTALTTLEYIIYKDYRGHDLCPCGSNNKLRNCHKDIILYWKSPQYHHILEKDHKLIMTEIRSVRNEQFTRRTK